MDDPVNPTATFAGGIGIESGICLSTGYVSDLDSPQANPHVGVNGANDGIGIDFVGLNHEGEINKIFQVTTPYSDEDFDAVNPGIAQGGDPAVLEFPINLQSPGFLRVKFVFGSDEFPAWIEGEFNDTIAILIKGPCTPTNSPGENIATFVDTGVTKPFSLHDLRLCPQLFLKNQMSPKALDENPNSEHKIKPPNGPEGYATYYDHEFGGFSKPLTRETKMALAPGQYTIKFVIEDILDRRVDSALFIQAHGLKLFALAEGDYNTNGCVDAADYVLWRHNVGKANPSFSDGDGNGDCIIDKKDYKIWQENFGNSGNTNFRADFNRDGVVDGADTAIQQQYLSVLDRCASRFEGDADGDGDVDTDDLNILGEEFGTCGGCGCGGSVNLLMAAGGAANTSGKSELPTDPDTNSDGVLGENELAALDQAVLGTSLAEYLANNPSLTIEPTVPQPTLAEPAPSSSSGDASRLSR